MDVLWLRLRRFAYIVFAPNLTWGLYLWEGTLPPRSYQKKGRTQSECPKSHRGDERKAFTEGLEKTGYEYLQPTNVDDTTSRLIDPCIKLSCEISLSPHLSPDFGSLCLFFFFSFGARMLLAGDFQKTRLHLFFFLHRITL